MPKVNPKRLKRIQQVAAQRQSGLVVVLQDIHDPHNAAAVFRTCEAFGIQEVYLIFEKEKYFNPRRIGKSSSASANKWLDFKIFRSTKECLARLRRKGYKILAASLHPQTKSLLSAKIPIDKLAIVLGNEHRGLSREAMKVADERVRIPMLGMVQSLNLSVTAAILIYEITRRRFSRFIKFRLPSPQVLSLVKKWSGR